ncbi:MAG: serine hydrolase domain-containing protein, partial [Balneolaceae bacterium]|nr:serine hydrolase domain-containing protein [Balneolaceae bacterium]
MQLKLYSAEVYVILLTQMVITGVSLMIFTCIKSRKSIFTICWATIIATVSITLLQTAPAFSQNWFPADTTIQATLEKLVNEGRAVGIVVGLLDADGTRKVITCGRPGPNALPLDGDTVFEIGSITKVFTGILLADMVRRGEVKLSEPIAQLLPKEVKVP